MAIDKLRINNELGFAIDNCDKDVMKFLVYLREIEHPSIDIIEGLKEELYLHKLHEMIVYFNRRREKEQNKGVNEYK